MGKEGRYGVKRILVVVEKQKISDEMLLLAA
jgi:hypothetical protein